MKIQHLLLASALFLTACSGSGAATTPAGTPSGTGSPTEPIPAKTSLESVPMILDPSRVPPEPDAAVNNATVSGIDSNNNGIRDDVERWIAQTYPNSARMRAAVAQVAKSLQDYIITSSTMTRDSAYQAALKGGDAVSCLVDSRAATNSTSGRIKEIMAIQMNTRARTLSYYAFQDALGSRLFKSADGDKCDVPASQLPN